MQCVLPGPYTQKTNRHATFATVAVYSFVSDCVLLFSFLLVIDKDFLSNPQTLGFQSQLLRAYKDRTFTVPLNVLTAVHCT